MTKDFEIRLWIEAYNSSLRGGRNTSEAKIYAEQYIEDFKRKFNN